MRYFYVLDEKQNISSLETKDNYEFMLDVFPYSEWIWYEETKESILIKEGFFGNSMASIVRKEDILKHLKIIIKRKKKGFEKYQITGFAKEFIIYLKEKFDITREDLASLV